MHFQDSTREIHGIQVLVCAPEGAVITREGDANALISAAIEAHAPVVAIAASRLGDDFFRLSTRLAGDIAQKFVNYRIHLVIVGDISRWTDESRALRDFVHEANRGRAVWFVPDWTEAERRLSAA